MPELGFGLVEHILAERPQFLLAFEEDLVAEGLPDLLGVEIRHAFEALAQGRGFVTDGVAPLFDGRRLPGETLLAGVQLKVQQGQRLLVGPDLPELGLDLDLPAVELAGLFRPNPGKFLLRRGFQLLGCDRGLSPRQVQCRLRLLPSEAPEVPHQDP